MHSDKVTQRSNTHKNTKPVVHHQRTIPTRKRVERQSCRNNAPTSKAQYAEEKGWNSKVVETRHRLAKHKTQKKKSGNAKFSKQGTDQQSTRRRSKMVERQSCQNKAPTSKAQDAEEKNWKGEVVETRHRSVFYIVQTLYSAILSVIVFKKRHGKTQKAGAEIRTRNPRFGIIRREPEPLR